MEITTGTLGIQCPELLAYGINNSFSTVSTIYQSLAESEDGKNLTKDLMDNPRILELLNEKIITGAGYNSFNINLFVQWYLWRINNVGQDQANQDLNTYLNSDTVPSIAAVWIYGIDVDKTIPLFDGFEIRPFSLMPESFDKYLFHGPYSMTAKNGNPSNAAIVKTVQIKKQKNPSKNVDPLKPDFPDSFYTLYEVMKVADLLSLINGCRPCKDSSSIYSPDHVPYGCFSNIGCGSCLEEVYTCFSMNLLIRDPEMVQSVESLYRGINERIQSEQDVLWRIVQRLSQAKRRARIEDKILDLGITMEMLLINERTTSELKYRFALRGSFLLTSTKKTRKEIFYDLKRFYDLRSAIAHSGVFSERESRLAMENIETYEEYVESICSYIILNGWPDWDTLILENS